MTAVRKDESEYRPTTAERKLLETLLQPDNRNKTVVELCAIAGVGRATYYRAFEKPRFVAFYKREARRLVDRAIAPMISAFIKEAVAGSYRHGKTLLEMSGMMGPESGVDDTPAPTKVEIVVKDARK